MYQHLLRPFDAKVVDDLGDGDDLLDLLPPPLDIALPTDPLPHYIVSGPPATLIN